MTTWLDKAKAQLAQHEQLLEVVEAIASVAKATLVKPGSDPYVVLQGIERLIDTLKAGFDGKVTHVEVDKQRAAFLDQLREGDAAIDASIDAKFGGTHE